MILKEYPVRTRVIIAVAGILMVIVFPKLFLMMQDVESTVLALGLYLAMPIGFVILLQKAKKLPKAAAAHRKQKAYVGKLKWTPKRIAFSAIAAAIPACLTFGPLFITFGFGKYPRPDSAWQGLIMVLAGLLGCYLLRGEREFQPLLKGLVKIVPFAVALAIFSLIL